MGLNPGFPVPRYDFGEFTGWKLVARIAGAYGALYCFYAGFQFLGLLYVWFWTRGMTDEEANQCPVSDTKRLLRHMYLGQFGRQRELIYFAVGAALLAISLMVGNATTENDADQTVQRARASHFAGNTTGMSSVAGSRRCLCRCAYGTLRCCDGLCTPEFKAEHRSIKQRKE